VKGKEKKLPKNVISNAEIKIENETSTKPENKIEVLEQKQKELSKEKDNKKKIIVKGKKIRLPEKEEEIFS